MSRPARHFYEFGPFTIETTERRLLRGGRPVPLTPKQFDTLLALVQRPGEIVTSDELLAKVWPGIFVEEGNVKVTLWALRKALGDDLQNGNRIIETVPRRGYCLVAAVTERSEETPEAIVPTVPPEPAAATGILPERLPSLPPAVTARRRLWPYAAILAFLLAATVVLWPYRPLPAPETISVEQLTHDRRVKVPPLFTDGSRVYFSESTPRGWALCSVSAAGGEARALSVPFGSFTTFDLSPDGSQFLVGSPTLAGEDMPLWIVPAEAGSPRRLDGIVARSAAWSPDGHGIAYISGASLYTASVDGSDIRKVANLPPHGWFLSWAPDGRWLRFNLFAGNPPSSLPQEVRADGSGQRRAVPSASCSDCLVEGSWTPNSRYFVFSVFKTISAGREFGTLWAERDTRGLFGAISLAPIRLVNDGRSYRFPVVSRDGKTVFAVGEDRSGELVRYDARAGQFISYLGGLEARWVTFAPDGRWVAYSRYSDGTLWAMHPDGGGGVQLTFAPMNADGMAWSPNGKWIAFRAQAKRGAPFKIYLIPSPESRQRAGIASPQELHLPERESEGIPTWSPDSTRIAYGEADAATSDQGTVKDIIHICDLATGLVTDLPGKRRVWTARWSPDGRYLAALTYDERQRLELYDVRLKRWRDTDADHIDNPTWSHDSKYVYYDVNAGEAASEGIFRVRIADGRIELAAPYHGMRRADGTWSGLTPDDSPIVLRDLGKDEIYALDVKWP
jgi:DNA-binding winged helix-turn-helix (wHTH) protein/Tol biopolymer transport system component